ncbi:MAG: hypothetical protein NWS83_09125 [Burkholderiaceae bacterium]|nr:hypothetical protein [Burkholderiaceae bacterium]
MFNRITTASPFSPSCLPPASSQRSGSPSALWRCGRLVVVLGGAALLTACGNPLGRAGIHVPIGGIGGVSIGVNTNGTLSGSVGVGTSRGGVSVGASTSGSTDISK